MKLLKTLQKARKSGFAVGAFNVSTFAQIKAVARAVRKHRVPTILEMSPGEAEFLGIETLAVIVKNLRASQGLPIFLNLDHAQKIENIQRALTAGFDLVHFDGSELPLNENIIKTREVVRLAHEAGVLVEGEIDQAGKHSTVNPGEGRSILTDPGKAARFVSETGVDILACFFGNLHGVYNHELELDLDHFLKIERAVEEARASESPMFFSLHGGSGVRGEDVRGAVREGIVKVNINTELRLAWARALRESLDRNRGEIVPYRILPPVVDRILSVVESKIELLDGSTDRG